MTRTALIRNVLNASLPTIDHARGVWLHDTQGKDYIDGSSGAVVTLVGHTHPRVIAAIADQAGRVTYTHRGAFTNEPAEALAEDLHRLTGYPGIWLVNSGSEAVEAAMQFALQYHKETADPRRRHFLSHRHGYHGNTLGGLSLSGHARRSAVDGLAAPWPTLPTPFPFRDAGGADDATFAARLLAEARTELERTAGTVAGVVVEVVGGATLAAVVPPDGYLQGLRELCDEFGVLLIFDEVMTGIARTGRTFAADHWEVCADIQVVGKGLGSGYAPIAAVLLSQRLVDAIAGGSGKVLGGHTYAANPLASAAARAVLGVVTDDNLTERAAVTGKLLGDLLTELGRRHDVVADVRGLGMMWGVELAADGVTGGRAQELTAHAARAGLLVYPATGGFNDAVLVAPPLVIDHRELQELANRLDTALSATGGA